MSNDVLKYIKNNLNSVEIFELSFAKQELLYYLENDTSGIKKFQKKLENRFDSRIANSIKYMNYRQFKDLKVRILKEEDFSKKFPHSYEYFKNLEIPEFPKPKVENYAIFIKQNLTFPEDIDYLFLYTYLYENDKENWNEIYRNSVVKYNYDNWLEYGYSEFRDSPNNLGKQIINKRIIKQIITENKNANNELVKKGLNMLSEYLE
ncbi:hypothetical protein QYS49_06300 [Marivirga salinae]|uniref:Uncharacterized protein n=1 Tax=Marivirga salinarum TaxID=3059078 RepID=A0AA49J8U4_9BACT|nr:hypothetical protein [Marivirga sp. BDSF4-3]WKK76867.2 hypothetical protein QYS49_06300 [Marivirga sp. BDSF4-3]